MSMSSDSVIDRNVALTGFSLIRWNLLCGETMEMKKSSQEDGGERLTMGLKVQPVY